MLTREQYEIAVARFRALVDGRGPPPWEVPLRNADRVYLDARWLVAPSDAFGEITDAARVAMDVGAELHAYPPPDVGDAWVVVLSCVRPLDAEDKEVQP